MERSRPSPPGTARPDSQLCPDARPFVPRPGGGLALPFTPDRFQPPSVHSCRESMDSEQASGPADGCNSELCQLSQVACGLSLLPDRDCPHEGLDFMQERFHSILREDSSILLIFYREKEG